jgi:hypothetical protein
MIIVSQTIVSPLRQRSKGRKSSIILGAYECHQVFMNIEEIHKMNAGFHSDLLQHSSSSQPCIGMLFSRHVSIVLGKRERENEANKLMVLSSYPTLNVTGTFFWGLKTQDVSIQRKSKTTWHIRPL